MNHTNHVRHGSEPSSNDAASFYAQLLEPTVHGTPKTSTPDRTRRARPDMLSSSIYHQTLANYNRTQNSSVCRSDELRRQIEEQYLSYLSRDDNSITTKQQIYKKLENLLTEYLFLIPNSRKFCFEEMHNCFCDTASERNFDPRRVVEAFQAIEHYVVNLINFPWRFEYRKINAFSGFFVHTIDRVLINYRRVFQLIGFKFCDKEQVYCFGDAPIDPDHLFQIALECQVAIVECKIMLEIYIESSSNGEKFSWSDVHSIRVDYVCNINNAVKLLADLKKTGKLIDLDATDYSVKRFNSHLESNLPSFVSHQQGGQRQTTTTATTTTTTTTTEPSKAKLPPLSNSSTYI